MEEGRKLQRISRSAKDPVELRRAIVVLMSAQGQTVKDITMLIQVGEDYVRDVIHAFNERGFDALNPKWNGGRAKTINDEAREHICLIARTSPADWKITVFSTWSLSKLAAHLIKQKVTTAISRERRRAAHARRSRPGHRQALLPDPAAQAVARVPRPPQGPAHPLARGEAVPDAGQLLPHKHAKVRASAADNDIQLVFLPTHGS
jgi:transposase